MKEKIDQEAKKRAADSGPADLTPKDDQGMATEGSRSLFGRPENMLGPSR
jgi:hypothetical protein